MAEVIFRAFREHGDGAILRRTMMTLSDTAPPYHTTRTPRVRRILEVLRAIHPREVALEGLGRLDDRTLAEMGIRDRRDIRRFVAGLF